jgi:serine/threonine protein kinase
MSTMPGAEDQFGPYLIRRPLGSGGMGAVYVATQTTLGRDVALKVLLPMYADAPDYRTRFAREAAALARVDSPHIIQIFDYGEHENRLFIATQLVGGGDLGVYLHERGALPVSDACLLAAQIASALADAHEAGVIHRDVKPANVLLRASADRPHVYLCDFGIATDGGEGLTTTGAVAGTWAYLAPERCQGADASRASDVYALGCLLWQLLTGNPPYAGSPAHVAMQHLTASIPTLAGEGEVTDSLNAFLHRALAKDVDEREADASAASAELERIGRLAAHHGSAKAEPATRTPPSVPAADPRWASSPMLPAAAEVDTEPIDGTPGLPPPATPAEAPAGGRRRRRTVLAIGLAALLGISAGITAWAVDRNGDDNGTENTPPASVAEGQISHRLTTGDFNGDGESDGLVQVAAGEGSSDLVLIPGTDAESAPPTTWAKDTQIPLNSALTASDVNGDEVTDLIALGQQRGRRAVRLLLGAPSGFEEPTEVGKLPVTGSVALVAGDITGDDNADLAAMAEREDGGSTMFVLTWNAETGRFEKAEPQQAWHPEWPADGTVIRTADIDRDGDSDVIALPPDTNDVWVFRAADGQLAEGEVWGSVERQPDSHVVTADFDGDDRSDLAVVVDAAVDGAEGVEVRVARAGDGAFLPAEPWVAVPGWTVDTMWVARAWIDHDGVADLMALHPAEGDVVTLSALVSDGQALAQPTPLKTVEDWRW